MSDNNGAQPQGNGQRAPQGGVVNFMMSNKIEAGLWLTRLFTVYSTIGFFLSFIGFSDPHSSYQRALLSSAATSALRLHQRVPQFSLSRECFARLLQEDSAHYLLFSFIFITSHPLSIALVPVVLFAILHACSYTIQVLNVAGPTSGQFVRNLVAKVQANQQTMLRFIACSEIFLMPAIILALFSGHGSLLAPFIYFNFLKMRYGSVRNPYCRQMFAEMRVAIHAVCVNPRCPTMVRGILEKAVSMVSNFAPPVATS